MALRTRVILRHAVFALVSAVLFAFLAAIYAWQATPIYQSSAVLLPVEPSDNGISQQIGGVGGLAALAGISLDSENSIKNEALATLVSRSFLSPFLTEAELMQELFFDEWNAESGAWHDEPPTLNDAHRRFVEDVMVVDDDISSGLVTVRIGWKDPAIAAAWANSIVSRLNAVMRAREISEAQRSIQFLNAESAKTSLIGVQNSISALLEKQIGRIMFANVREEFVFRFIDSAVASDVDDPVFPKTPILIATGFLFGLLFGGAIAFARESKLLLIEQ
jgi:uncharacterized protein involved in exopolysaccharide biosynthesis